MQLFNYHKPTSLDEASSLYRMAEDPIYLGGGMTLIPTMKQRLASPTDVIDLSGIDQMRGVVVSRKSVSIGALTCHNEIANNAEIQSTLPVLSSLAKLIGDNQVRNRGTLGGSIANSDPAADYPASVVALGATIYTQDRTISGDVFFQALFETALEPGEIITRVEFQVPTRAVYQKFPNPASRYAVVGVLVADFAGEIRVGVTGAGPCAFRARDMEAVLNRALDPDGLQELGLSEVEFNSDLHASAEYRAHLLYVLVRRAIVELVALD
jgi:carbon-monoxide dehydrogenase medium subunit